ncbi:hypothetical protein ACFXKG_35495 [Streptomyces sp. NPDC059255]|uniref:hypothetical protein n=1 Tax=Streptomyces sp. NPDC059255 TaxID=3346793 RepID=UPI0036CED43F
MSSNPFRAGTGRHRNTAGGSRLTRGSAVGVVAMAGASILCAGAGAQADDDDSSESGPVAGRNVGLVVIDNSHADSWLEVDRTLNTLISSKGTAGSDHDGGGGAIDVRTGDTSGTAPAPVTAPAPAPAPGAGQGQAQPPAPATESGTGTASPSALSADPSDQARPPAPAGAPPPAPAPARAANSTPSLLGWIAQIGHPPWQGDDGEGD